jgi:hypothetical protein
MGLKMTKVDIKEQIVERLQTLGRVDDAKPTQTTTQQPSEAPRVSKASQPAFYELDRYVKLRDPLMLVGIGLLLYGVSRFSMPVMFILAGIIVLGISWMMAR